MICNEAKINMQRLLDGRLSDQDAEVLRAHIEQCPSCAQEWHKLKELDSLLANSLLMPDLPADFVDSVMAFISDLKVLPAEKANENQKALPKAPAWKRFGLVAAAIVTVIGVSAFGIWQNQEPGAPPVQVADTGNVDNGETTPENQQPDTTPSDPGTGDVTNPDPTEPEGQTGNDTPKDTEQEPADNQGDAQTNIQENDHSGSVNLPPVAYNSVSSGAFEMVLLAEHAGLPVFAPQVADDTVYYYVKTDDGYQQWQQKLDPDSLPVLVADNVKIEQTAALSTDSEISWLDGKKYVLAYSTDGSMIAANIKGEGLGVSYNTPDACEILVTENGGGEILEWSPNDGKIAFTDDEGKLHVYYVAEDKDILVFEGTVSAINWSLDSKKIVIAGRDADDATDNLYRVIVP